MSLSLRRVGIAFGALVEAMLALWLLAGFLPAGMPLGLLALVLGFAIYRDIIRRELPARAAASPWRRPVSPIFFLFLLVAGLGIALVAYLAVRLVI